MNIFQETAPPIEQSKLEINRCATWYTWAPEFRALTSKLTDAMGQLKRPKWKTLKTGNKRYADTYTVDIFSIRDESLAEELMLAARSLHSLLMPDHIVLLTGLLGCGLAGKGLHFLFAYFQAAITMISGDELSALYQPLSRRQKAFPLHADLYLPRVLFNVFEDVPADETGASLFLSVADFQQLLPSTEVPKTVQRRLMRYLASDYRRDHYDEFYHLLYDHPWSKELTLAMTSQQKRVKLFAGQGYLINDRKWLHGREAPSSRVTRRRLYRLTFNTRSTDSENY